MALLTRLAASPLCGPPVLHAYWPPCRRSGIMPRARPCPALAYAGSITSLLYLSCGTSEGPLPTTPPCLSSHLHVPVRASPSMTARGPPAPLPPSPCPGLCGPSPVGSCEGLTACGLPFPVRGGASSPGALPGALSVCSTAVRIRSGAVCARKEADSRDPLSDRWSVCLSVWPVGMCALCFFEDQSVLMLKW